MPGSSRCPRSRVPAGGGHDGFVLVMTLWVLAGITIAVALMTLWALDAVRDAGNARVRTEEALAMRGTRDTLLYLGATRALTLAGLPTDPLPEDERALLLLNDMGAFRKDPRGGELRLDGQPYQGIDGIMFQLQDEAGLLSLILPQPTDVDRFLERHDVEAGTIPRLRDALLDYTDADALRRLDGAEEDEYERESLPPPPNRQLLVPAEFERVLGWGELPAAFREAVPELVTTYYGGAVNLNTMPAALLPAWIPGCPEKCAALVARRAQAPFRSGNELETLLALQLPGDELLGYRFLGSEVVRMTLLGSSGTAIRIHVRFTPLADQQAPWSILAAYPVPRPTEHVPAQPTGSDLFADPPPG